MIPIGAYFEGQVVVECRPHSDTTYSVITVSPTNISYQTHQIVGLSGVTLGTVDNPLWWEKVGLVVTAHQEGNRTSPQTSEGRDFNLHPIMAEVRLLEQKKVEISFLQEDIKQISRLARLLSCRDMHMVRAHRGKYKDSWIIGGSNGVDILYLREHQYSNPPQEIYAKLCKVREDHGVMDHEVRVEFN